MFWQSPGVGVLLKQTLLRDHYRVNSAEHDGRSYSRMLSRLHSCPMKRGEGGSDSLLQTFLELIFSKQVFFFFLIWFVLSPSCALTFTRRRCTLSYHKRVQKSEYFLRHKLLLWNRQWAIEAAWERIHSWGSMSKTDFVFVLIPTEGRGRKRERHRLTAVKNIFRPLPLHFAYPYSGVGCPLKRRFSSDAFQMKVYMRYFFSANKDF